MPDCMSRCVLHLVNWCCCCLPNDPFEEIYGTDNTALLDASPSQFTLESVFREPDAADFTIPFSMLSLGCAIGSGSSGVVWNGKLNSQPVAIKQLICLLMTPDQKDAVDEFRHESSILAKVCHPPLFSLFE